MSVVKPAKKLSLLLQSRMILETASTTSGLKFNGADVKQFHLIADSHNMFLCGYGPAVDLDNFTLMEDQAFEKLAGELGQLKKIKFHLPVLPVSRGVEHCSADLYRDVAIRVIEYYEIRIDEVLTRYDVLVQVAD